MYHYKNLVNEYLTKIETDSRDYYKLITKDEKDAEFIKAIAKSYHEIISDYAKDRKDQIMNIMKKFSNRFFLAPAAAKTEYHGAFPGGLALHSLGVFENLIRLRKAWDVEDKIDSESCLIVALFHDMGKIGDENYSYYNIETEQWKLKRGINYNFRPHKFIPNDKEDVFLPVPHTSLFLLMNNGLKLTKDEFQAILFHDGVYIDENKKYGFNWSILTELLHQSDITTIKLENI